MAEGGAGIARLKEEGEHERGEPLDRRREQDRPRDRRGGCSSRCVPSSATSELEHQLIDPVLKDLRPYRIAVPRVPPFSTQWLSDDRYPHTCGIDTGYNAPAAYQRSADGFGVSTGASAPGKLTALAVTATAGSSPRAHCQRDLLARATKRVRKRTVSIRPKPTKAGRRALQESKALRVTVTIACAPTGGGATTA